MEKSCYDTVLPPTEHWAGEYSNHFLIDPLANCSPFFFSLFYRLATKFIKSTKLPCNIWTLLSRSYLNLTRASIHIYIYNFILTIFHKLFLLVVKSFKYEVCFSGLWLEFMLNMLNYYLLYVKYSRLVNVFNRLTF